jgi:hypothetical protein
MHFWGVLYLLRFHQFSDCFILSGHFMRWFAEGMFLAPGHLAPEAGDGAKKHQVEREPGILQGAGSTPNPGSGGVHAVEMPLQER